MQTAINRNRLWYTAFVCERLGIARYRTDTERLLAQSKIYVLQSLTPRLAPYSFRYGILGPYSQSLADTIEESIEESIDRPARCPDYYVDDYLHVLHPYFRLLDDETHEEHAARCHVLPMQWWNLLACAFYAKNTGMDVHELFARKNLYTVTLDHETYVEEVRERLSNAAQECRKDGNDG